MKNPNRLRWSQCWLPINVAAMVLFSGCTTPEQHSFNADYKESLPTKPNYYITDQGAGCFNITVSQGVPSSGAERVINVKQAASSVARAECQRRGWEKWDLNYIQDRDAGWMHVVVAQVIRQ